jgi:ABC-2 type transport system permease protein
MTTDGTRPGPRNEPLFPNALTIAKREYVERVSSRLFTISTLILATLAVLVAMSPVFLRVLDRGSVTRVAIVTTEPNLGVTVRDLMATVLNSQSGTTGGSTYALEVVPDLAATEEGGFDAALVVTRGAGGGLDFDLRTSESVSADRLQLMQVGALGVGLIEWAQNAGAAPAMPSFTTTAVDGPNPGGPPVSSSEYASRRIVGIVFVVLIFITLVIYGMWVAAGVVAEKSSRVMELLISAASARQLVVGKVIGIGAAGATQYAAVLSAALVTLFLEEGLSVAMLGPEGSIAPSLVSLSPGLLLAFAAYYVLGFALYALIYAAAGSLVSRPEDLQIIALPLSLLAIVGYFQAVLALSGGIAGFIRFASYVPFWSPFVMLTRLSVGRVEAWELALSFGLLVATIGVVGVIAIRIYAAGVLLYGQRPGLRAYVTAARGR